MKLAKRIMGLERHRFAPELNELHIDTGLSVIRVNTPGCKTIKEAKKMLFSPMTLRRQAVVSTEYTGDKAWLNRTHAGSVKNYAEVRLFVEQLKARMLPDGSGSVRVRTRLVGNTLVA